MRLSIEIDYTFWWAPLHFDIIKQTISMIKEPILVSDLLGLETYFLRINVRWLCSENLIRMNEYYLLYMIKNLYMNDDGSINRDSSQYFLLVDPKVTNRTSSDIVRQCARRSEYFNWIIIILNIFQILINQNVRIL